MRVPEVEQAFEEINQGKSYQVVSCSNHHDIQFKLLYGIWCYDKHILIAFFLHGRYVCCCQSDFQGTSHHKLSI